MTVYSPLIGNLWKTLESYGIDPRETIPASVYRPGREQEGRRTPQGLYDELLVACTELIDDPAVGLRAAKLLHPSHLGALGHAWLAAGSLRDAIMRSSRYHRMINERIRMEVRERAQVLEVIYRWHERTPVIEALADSFLASLLQLCRLNFGPELRPVFVRMQHAAPADTEPWTDFFGVEVEFGAADDAIGLTAEDADRPLTVASTDLVALHEEILQRQLARLDRDDVVNRARVAIIDELPSGGATEETVARRLGMSPRTLYNHLATRELSFRRLMRSVREQLAQRYLKDPTYTITEVSFLLGFSDSSAFSRAFRSWVGMSPSEYKNDRQVGA